MDTHRIMELFNQHKLRLPWIVAAVVALITLSTLLSDIDYFRFSVPSMQGDTTHNQAAVNLANLHLFGLFSDDFDDLPETQLQLTLEGTGVSEQDAKLSTAIIASPGGKAHIYHIGENVPGDAMVKDILFDRIVINNNGELQKLSMKIPALHNQAASNGLPINSGLSPS